MLSFAVDIVAEAKRLDAMLEKKGIVGNTFRDIYQECKIALVNCHCLKFCIIFTAKVYAPEIYLDLIENGEMGFEPINWENVKPVSLRNGLFGFALD